MLAALRACPRRRHRAPREGRGGPGTGTDGGHRCTANGSGRGAGTRRRAGLHEWSISGQRPRTESETAQARGDLLLLLLWEPPRIAHTLTTHHTRRDTAVPVRCTL